MKPRQQRMLAVGLAALGIAIAAGLTLRAFEDNMMFFVEISDVVAGNYPSERNFRIGGLVVGTIAGAPLQVSGPAAGLSVIVWQLIQTHGLATLGIIVGIAGLFQIAAGLLGIGRWFRAVSQSHGGANP